MKLKFFIIALASSFVMGETFKVDTKESSIMWKGTKKIGSFHDGSISFKEGSLEIKDGMIQSGTLVVDMDSITNNDLKDSPDYQKKLVGHLKSEDFFNVAKFPTSTLKIKKVEKKKEGFEFTADLSILDNTNEIKFPAMGKVEGQKASGEANVKIDRTKWKIVYGSGNFFKNLVGDKIISDEFELNIKIVAKK